MSGKRYRESEDRNIDGGEGETNVGERVDRNCLRWGESETEKDNGERTGRVRKRKDEARSRARDGGSDERVKFFQIPLAPLWVSNLLGLLGLQVGVARLSGRVSGANH